MFQILHPLHTHDGNRWYSVVNRNSIVIKFMMGIDTVGITLKPKMGIDISQWNLVKTHTGK